MSLQFFGLGLPGVAKRKKKTEKQAEAPQKNVEVDGADADTRDSGKCSPAYQGDDVKVTESQRVLRSDTRVKEATLDQFFEKQQTST